MPVWIRLVHIGNHIPLKLFKTAVLHAHDRTDPHDSEHPLKIPDHILVIIILPAIHIDPGLGLMNLKLAFHILQTNRYHRILP